MELVLAGVDEAVVVVVVLAGKTVVAVATLKVGRPALVGVDIGAGSVVRAAKEGRTHTTRRNAISEISLRGKVCAANSLSMLIWAGKKVGKLFAHRDESKSFF